MDFIENLYTQTRSMDSLFVAETYPNRYSFNYEFIFFCQSISSANLTNRSNSVNTEICLVYTEIIVPIPILTGS